MPKTKTQRLQATALIAAVFVGLGIGSLKPPIDLDHTVDLFAEYLLPLFFIAVGLELRHEFTSGLFRDKRNIVAPTLAAFAGVALPAVVYLLVAGAQDGGWAVPTATDITIGLALLAFASTSLASATRPRFLALATIDDVIGLVIILLIFTGRIDIVWIAVCLTSLVAYRFANYREVHWALQWLLIAVIVAASVEAGIQSSIVAVLVGLLTKGSNHLAGLERINGWYVLPAFSFLVATNAGSHFGQALTASILIAILMRPVAKLIGISVIGYLVERGFGLRGIGNAWILTGLLGGCGFTVSILLANLAHDSSASALLTAVIGTLLATAISAAAFLGYAKIKTRLKHQDAKSL